MTPAPGTLAADAQLPTTLLPQNGVTAGPGGPDERALLLRCISDPASASALPPDHALERLFGDELHRRAAAHLRDHATTPTADLPADDHDLVSLITGLLSAPAHHDE